MALKREKIKVFDMTCKSCERKVENSIKKLDGVTGATASYSDESVIIEYDTELCNSDIIKAAIKKSGYSTEKSNLFKLTGLAIIAFAVIYLGKSANAIDMSSRLTDATYLVLFVVGILTSLHCIGMCGGIMLTQSLKTEDKSRFSSIKPALLYNLGRVVSYTIIGGIVGALGSVISLSLNFKAGLQVFAGVFMIIMGLNLSGFSLFKKINLTLPFSSCKIKNKPKAPFLVGVVNGLMPCGPLQTMQLYALGTGSALTGALSMFVFSLGTVPLMLTFGALSGLLSKNNTKSLLKFSGILVIVLGIIMSNRGLVLAGVPTPMTLMRDTMLSSEVASQEASSVTIENGVQIIKMSADVSGYSPNTLYVQKDMPVKWIIDGKGLNSCNNAIVVPSLNVEKKLKSGENVIEFTPGDKDISFSCWMGMIRGVIKVVDDVETVDTSKSDPSVSNSSGSGMSCHGGNTTTQGPSIYGDDFSKVPTDRIIRKSILNGSTQTISITGTGYEFEPLIIVLNKGIKTKLTLDLNNFDNPTGYYLIMNLTTRETVTSFQGEQGIVNTEFTIPNSGEYGIVKDGILVEAIDVVDNVNTANLEQIRLKYLY
ncbi:MAG: sulfite exporter TauE/SafE family protein [Clostridiaceae bacterium]